MREHEDGELMAFVKKRLEENVAAVPPGLDAIKQAAMAESFAKAARNRLSSRYRWLTYLVAASFATICFFTAQNFLSTQESERTVVRIIDLLRAADGDIDNVVDMESSVDEMLLAWQDAPYERAIHDLDVN